MRHKVAGRRLSRTKEHRLAMRRNLVSSLIEHETISTTIEKAKEVKPFAEKLITLAKKGTLQARRRAISLLGNRAIIGVEDGKEVKKGTVIGKLFSELGPRYLDRPGGYSRIIRLSMKRLVDNGQLVLLQLVGADEKVIKTTKKKSKKHSENTEQSEPEQASSVDEVAEEEEFTEVEESTEIAEDVETEQANESEDQNEKNQ
jgi:large subunit ribosomal protein L17